MLADDTREGSAMASKTRQRVSRHYLRNSAHFEVCNLRKTQNKSMNKKVIRFLSSLAAVAVAVPLAQADPRGGRGGGVGHFGRAPARGGFAMTRGAGTFRQGGFNHWNGNRWNGNRWSGDWRHRGHFRDRDRFIFFGDFGFPYYYGYPYYGSYPYDYYGYGYGYGY